MKEFFSIGEIANLFDIKITTLRYYDDINLLKPQYTDKDSNYRYYSTNQFERLNTIKYLRNLDMPLKKIIEFFGNREVDVLVSMLKEQQVEITRKKIELELTGRKIENRLLQIEDAANTNYNVIEEKHIINRKTATLKGNIKVGDDIEYPIACLSKSNKLNTAIFLGKVAFSIEKEDLINNRFEEFSSVLIIVEDEDGDSENFNTINGGDYITLRFQGTHNEAKEYYPKMLKYLDEKKYNIIGNSLEIAMIDYGMTNDLSKFVTEIQIPYEKTLTL